MRRFRLSATLMLAGWMVAMASDKGAAALGAEDRAEKIRRDRQELADDSIWLYNDFQRATEVARQTGKPLMVAIRCVPCEACSKFDEELLSRPAEVRDLLDDFVCVRIIQANGLDLSLFQFDYDQSFHILFLHPDRTIYGRYGTRSERPEQQDMTMAGLRQAMQGALQLHAEYPANRQALAGKQSHPVSVQVPEQLPALKGLYGAQLDFDGQLVKSCIHCHQIRDAQRDGFRMERKPIPDQVLFPYPLPDALGLQMNPDQRATIRQVAEGSIGERAGLQAGDQLVTLEGQPLLSTADIQWVLHHAPSHGSLTADVVRNGQRHQAHLMLDEGWRRRCDISWRVTTWNLRRMATGGLVLEEATDEQRREHGLGGDSLALRVKYVGQYGDHGAAKRAGFAVDDLIVGINGQQSPRMSEGQFIAEVLANPPGSTLRLQVLRGSEESLELALPIR